MFVLVSYDISNDRSRTKVAKILRDHGTRVQYSVFECNLTEKQKRKLQARLARYIAEGDSIRYYTLCALCREKVEIEGVGEVTRDQDFYLA
jgi:CRISPR-associated protein Cas2